MSAPAPSRGWRRLAGEGRTFLTAVIALVAAATGLLFQLVPALKPDPRERVGASVEIFAVERGVPVGVWLRETFVKDVKEATRRVFGDRPAAADELGVEGTVVYVRAEVDGYKHRDITLRVRLYDWATQERVDRDFPQLYRESSRVAIDSPNRRSVQPLFVPDLRYEERAEFLRVSLVDSETGSILAVADSPKLVRGRIVR